MSVIAHVTKISKGQPSQASIEELSAASAGWSAASRQSVTTKTIEYECGCEAKLSAFGPRDAGYACHEHLKPVKKITTIETFI